MSRTCEAEHDAAFPGTLKCAALVPGTIVSDHGEAPDLCEKIADAAHN